jgi:hypothetical protein
MAKHQTSPEPAPERELPPHVIAEVQRILDQEARLALADELDVEPARIPPTVRPRRA